MKNKNMSSFDRKVGVGKTQDTIEENVYISDQHNFKKSKRPMTAVRKLNKEARLGSSIECYSNA
jgi:hypothetical protein